MEKLQIRLERGIPGLDHLKLVDHEAFADAHHWWDKAAEVMGADKVNDFYVYEGEYGKARGQWHSAGEGLAAVRAVIAYYREGKGKLEAELRETLLKTLAAIEGILDEADTREIRFCFVGDY